eukprot:SAG11_NODE_24163_length_377_cov_0.913669_1_plen_52_part_10
MHMDSLQRVLSRSHGVELTSSDNVLPRILFHFQKPATIGSRSWLAPAPVLYV